MIHAETSEPARGRESVASYNAHQSISAVDVSCIIYIVNNRAAKTNSFDDNAIITAI